MQERTEVSFDKTKLSAFSAAPGILVTTDITIDNLHGLEDLLDVTLYFLQYGTSKTVLHVLSKKVKRGKKEAVQLPADSNPCGFFLLWRTGSFYRFMGDGSTEDHIYDNIDFVWGSQDLEDLKISLGGYSANASKP